MRLVITLVLVFIATSAISNELTLWVMASEFSNKTFYSDEQISHFIRKYNNTTIDIGKDSSSSLQILMKNREILERVETFRHTFNITHNNQDPVYINVHFIGWHNTPLQKIITNAVKHHVDIVQIGSTWVAPLAQQKVIKNIHHTVKRIENDFINSAMQSARYGSPAKYYAVPWSVDIRTWFYNSLLINNADISEIKNLADFTPLCANFKEQHPGDTTWLLGLPTSSEDFSTLHVAMAWVWGWGGRIIDDDENVNLLEGNVIDGLTSYFKLVVDGCAPLKNSSGEFLRLVDIEEAFLHDRYGFIFIGPWIVDALSDYQSEKFINYGAIPGIDGSTPNTFTGGSHLALVNSKRTATEEAAALALIAYLSQNGIQGVGLPPYKKHLVQMLDDSEFSQFPIILLKQEFRSFPAVAGWGSVEKIVLHHLANIFSYIDKYPGLSNAQLKSIITKEMSVAQLVVEDIVKQENKNIYWVVIIAVLLIGFINYILRKKTLNVEIDECELIKNIQCIKETLHSVKVCVGMVNKENEGKIRENYSHKLKNILNKYLIIKTKSCSNLVEYIHALHNSELIVKKYLRVFQYHSESPEHYERSIIVYFEEKIRPIINQLSDMIDRYYVSTHMLKKIFDRLSKMIYFNYRIDDEILALNIGSRDLELCLNNLLMNSKKSISQSSNPKIFLQASKKRDSVLISIFDNGEPFPHVNIDELIERGEGLKDTKEIIARWGGDLSIVNNTGSDEKPPITITLKHRRRRAENETKNIDC